MSVWTVDADIVSFDYDSIKNVLLRNGAIDIFLDAKDTMGLSASKGMGKTFILKTKRLYSQKMSGVLCLPENNMVDTHAEISFKSQNVALLSDYNNWVKLWLSCISVYLLSHEKVSLSYETDESLSETAKSFLSQKHFGVFDVLNKTLRLASKADLYSLLDDAGIMFQMLNLVNHPIHLFIDKVEEPFNRYIYKTEGSSKATSGPYPENGWQFAQLALSEAAYKIYTLKRHIKIFYTIRKEALHNIENISVDPSKLKGRIVDLIYQKDDLEKMFYKYIEFEDERNLLQPEKKPSCLMEAFLAINSLPHYTGSEERVIEYIIRHTLMRPRDLMVMGLDLYTQYVCFAKPDESPEALTQKIRTRVNTVSRELCNGYISQIEPFWHDSGEVSVGNKIYDISRLLPTNILTRDDVKRFCCEMNKKSTIDCGSCNEIHIFSTLYTSGLLGAIRISNIDEGYRGRFNDFIYDPFLCRKQSIPDARLYFAHSCFRSIIERERTAADKSFEPSKILIANETNYVPEVNIVQVENGILRIKEELRSKEGDRNTNRVFYVQHLEIQTI